MKYHDKKTLKWIENNKRKSQNSAQTFWNENMNRKERRELKRSLDSFASKHLQYVKDFWDLLSFKEKSDIQKEYLHDIIFNDITNNHKSLKKWFNKKSKKYKTRIRDSKIKTLLKN